MPQGSKIGPILYLIYANNLLNFLNGIETFSYADDTAVIIADKSYQRASLKLQKVFDNIVKWSHDNGLTINVKKTRVMHIKPANSLQENIIQIYHNPPNCKKDTRNSEVIQMVSTYKYLGVVIDDRLSWQVHISEVQKKLQRAS